MDKKPSRFFGTSGHGGAPEVERPNPRPAPRVAEASDLRVPTSLARARRARRPRRRINRRQAILVSVLVALVAIFGGYGLTRSPALDLDRVAITGTQQTDPAAIETASGLVRGHALTDLRLDIARRQIEALPWVDRARLARRWPGTVAIAIVERVPVAAVTGTDGELAIVDRGGRVLARPGRSHAFAAAVPVEIDDDIVEVGQIQPGMAPLLAVATALPGELRPWIERVGRDRQGQPELILRDGVQVVLGETTLLAGKFIDLATVLTRVDLKDICRINVSALHTPAVVRRPNC